MQITTSKSFVADFSTLPEHAKTSTFEVIQAAQNFSTIDDVHIALGGTIELTARGFTYSIKNNFQHVLGSLIAEVVVDGELNISIVLFD